MRNTAPQYWWLERCGAAAAAATQHHFSSVYYLHISFIWYAHSNRYIGEGGVGLARLGTMPLLRRTTIYSTTSFAISQNICAALIKYCKLIFSSAIHYYECSCSRSMSRCAMCHPTASVRWSDAIPNVGNRIFVTISFSVVFLGHLFTLCNCFWALCDTFIHI